MRLRTAGFAVLAFLLLGAGVAQAHLGGSAAGGVASYAPADQATIRPGVQTNSPAGQCTSNFIFTAGTGTYIGQAAHCTGTSDATVTNGCDAGSLPLGTEVEIEGASMPGVLVYSSWLAMQAVGETDPNACAYNDFGLIRIDPADVGKVNPTLSYWGGPTGVNTTGTTLAERVYTYGDSSLRLGLSLLSPKTGVSLGTVGDGWNHTVYTVTPGIPGDSGSAVLDSAGRGLGVLVTVQFLPLAGSNGITDLNHIVNYARSHSSFTDLQVVNGTEPLNGNRIPPL